MTYKSDAKSESVHVPFDPMKAERVNEATYCDIRGMMKAGTGVVVSENGLARDRGISYVE